VDDLTAMEKRYQTPCAFGFLKTVSIPNQGTGQMVLRLLVLRRNDVGARFAGVLRVLRVLRPPDVAVDRRFGCTRV